jgi:hypothetical protein
MCTTATYCTYTQAGTSLFARSKICHSRKSQDNFLDASVSGVGGTVCIRFLYVPDINGTIFTYYTAQVEPVILLSLRVMFVYFKITSV